MHRSSEVDEGIQKIKFTSIEPISLDGLNSGVPTQTTDTLTPTTLRNIQQTFLDLQCSVEPHQNQARFVPPVVQPTSQVIQKAAGFMSVVDTKSWHGGSARVTDQPAHAMDLNKISSQPRRNVGGRRPVKDKTISPEEEKRRAERRERNKMAAARCRKRRLDHTNELVMETDGLQERKQQLQSQIQQLKSQKEELEFLLEAHKPCCRIMSDLPRPLSPPDIKPFSADSIKMEIDESLDAKEEPVIKIGKRPTSLPVPQAFPVSSIPASEVVGVPITTPTAGLPFNFDSLMDGGTGLTPVTGLIPSCASQQRNMGSVDLSSPDSGKLVSL